jgi:diaminopimelate epimerase
MKITKMHGLGNDFIITEEAVDYHAAAVSLCRRRLAVGADGLIAVCPSDKADIRMRIINSDGSEAEMCGNGIRCFARYIYDRGIVKKENMEIETLAGIMKPQLITEGGEVKGVRVDMGVAELTPEAIPVLTDTPMDFEVPVGGRRFSMSAVLVGVPHAVVFCDSLEDIEVEKVGPQIEKHYLFPRNINVDFVEVVDGETVKMDTWERGAGRTLACGTGACSVAFVAKRKGFTGDRLRVQLEAGELLIEQVPDGHIFMTGPAEYVFTGEADWK